MYMLTESCPLLLGPIMKTAVSEAEEQVRIHDVLLVTQKERCHCLKTNNKDKIMTLDLA